MNWEQLKSQIKAHFGEAILKWREHNVRRIYVDIAPETLLQFGRYLFETLAARFIIASAVDVAQDSLEVLYHFDFQGLPQVISLRVTIKKTKPELDSLARVIKGSYWIEQEMHELFGITFRNHPHMKHLLLPDDWPNGNYPLRREP